MLFPVLGKGNGGKQLIESPKVERETGIERPLSPNAVISVALLQIV